MVKIYFKEYQGARYCRQHFEAFCADWGCDIKAINTSNQSNTTSKVICYLADKKTAEFCLIHFPNNVTV